VTYESDSKIVVDAIFNSFVGTCEFSTLISKIEYLFLLYSNFEMKFIKRHINIVTHTLAMMTYSCPSHCLIDLIPLYIENYLINNNMN
jgi:hypothetical protein